MADAMPGIGARQSQEWQREVADFLLEVYTPHTPPPLTSSNTDRGATRGPPLKSARSATTCATRAGLPCNRALGRRGPPLRPPPPPPQCRRRGGALCLRPIAGGANECVCPPLGPSPPPSLEARPAGERGGGGWRSWGDDGQLVRVARQAVPAGPRPSVAGGGLAGPWTGLPLAGASARPWPRVAGFSARTRALSYFIGDC